MNVVAETDRELLEIAANHIPWALNKKSNPRLCAVALGEKGHYRGNNIFLSNRTLSCAEANAIAAAVAEGDQRISKLYMAAGRADSQEAPMVPRCWQVSQLRFTRRTAS